MLAHEAEHLLELLLLLVHVDREVELGHRDVELLGLVELPLAFELLRQPDVPPYFSSAFSAKVVNMLARFGSFSAASAPIFAQKYVFCSMFYAYKIL